MKYKIMALLVPLILVLSGVGAATGSFAEGSTPSPSQSDCKEFVIGQDFFLKTNESEYVNYSYTSTWKIGDGVLLSYTHTYKADESKYVDTKTAGGSVKDNGITYTLVKDTMVGLYKVSTGGAAAADRSTTISWDLSVTVKQGETEKTISVNSMDVEVKPVSPASVYVRPFATSMPYVGQVYNKEMEATIVSGANELSIVGTKVGDVDKGSAVTWYAIGLPEGLSMSSDGHINGVAKNYTSMDEPAEVNVAISYEGAVYTGTFYIYTQGTQSSEFMMYVDGMEISNDGFFMGIKGSGNVLVIKDEGGAVIGDSRLIVNTVNIDGRISSLGRDGDGYVLPDIGTGAYLVTVTMMDELNLLKPITKSFTFYNLPPGVISADIIVNGN